eukprot:1023527-Pleurochrysis_carterae.AAC.1
MPSSLFTVPVAERRIPLTLDQREMRASTVGSAQDKALEHVIFCAKWAVGRPKSLQSYVLRGNRSIRKEGELPLSGLDCGLST